MNEDESLVFDSIANEPKITYAKLSEKLAINRKSIQRHVQKLKKSGKLKRVGSTRSGHWEIAE